MKPQRNRARDIGFYVLILVLLACTLFTLLNQEPENELSYAQVKDFFKDEKVQEFTYNGSKNLLEMKVKDSSAKDGYKTVYYKMYSFSLFYEEFGDLIDEQYDKGIIKDYQIEPVQSTWWLQLIPYVLFIGFMVFWIVMMQRAQGGGGAGGAMKFGKARTRLGSEEKNRKTFNDVAGADEEKAELQELVEFLKDPKSFTKMGARIPKGVLLVGPPGTGKTLLAKAVAGEAGVQFLSISGSDFVELYVGVGASRVRDLFDTAKKNMPCIIFIDEIDAVGRQRGAGLGGGNDEREQTLNQLLVQMDGFTTNDGIIVMAATNRADILDPALVRPGRFDRQIFVNRPDVRGREAILKVHARKKPIGPDVNFRQVARITAGFTGADLENLLNEAAILAVRDGRKVISMADVNEGINKVVMGPAKKSRLVTEPDKRITAYHEAGHAILGSLLKYCDPIHEVTIIPRGQAAGYTMSRPDNDNDHVSKQQLLDEITMGLGGRVAEELIIKNYCTGASGDIKMITDKARRMVTEWGMSDRIGPLFYGSDGEIFVGRNYQTEKGYSEEIAGVIDEEIRAIVESCHKRATEILSGHLDVLHNMARVLIERETIHTEEVEMLVAGKSVDEVLAEMDKSDNAGSNGSNGKANGTNGDDANTTNVTTDTATSQPAATSDDKTTDGNDTATTDDQNK